MFCQVDQATMDYRKWVKETFPHREEPEELGSQLRETDRETARKKQKS
jgi:hypothetical protein